MTIRCTTDEIGLAIRDQLEETTVENSLQGVASDQTEWPAIVMVDSTDPSNLIAFLDNGQKFRIRIFAEDANG